MDSFDCQLQTGQESHQPKYSDFSGECETVRKVTVATSTDSNLEYRCTRICHRYQLHDPTAATGTASCIPNP